MDSFKIKARSEREHQEIFTQQVEEIFCSALELENAAERKAYLDRACGGDENLRLKVHKMLSASSDANQFFEESVPALQPSEKLPEIVTGAIPSQEKPGTRIGLYRLLEVIGEGGCGTVYRAEQEKPVRRHVAFKIIKMGMDTKSVVARFDAERQALALMDHPNIAHVLDAGATETGRPYFVMELVHGIKLTTYCDENQLDTRQRLKLFIQVCHAIQHAHQKGIIHRDIKPSNILVSIHDGMPMPLVIDFGIAKAIEGRLTDDTLFTPYEHFIGTPAYMSPEQAQLSRLDVDTRSDIYSLGVLLYELLTGKTPFESAQLLRSGLDEMRRTLSEQEPLRPSSIVTTLNAQELTQTAKYRGAEAFKLVSLLRGDLDWIVMKSLEKDRNRRYQTANALAMDVQRYLDNEPILARPPSQFYRLRKLVRRNKVVFVSGAVVAISLAAGLGIAITALLRERELRQRATAAEKAQSRLRAVAERGLATEAELRRQAERREKIMRAAVLIERGLYDEADTLVAELPLEQSTMEGAEVFRILGDWDAVRERWAAAKDRFHLLQYASRFYKPTDSSLDWTRTAVAIVENDDREDYERFCRDSIESFGSTDDPIVAGRIVRNCILIPPSPTVIDSLKPMSECAQRPLIGIDFSANNVVTWQIAWRCQVLGLWEYRIGNFSEAAMWCKRCLAAGEDPPVRSASARAILAMALQRLGKPDEASVQLELARNIIKKKFSRPMALDDSSDGMWFDWVVARILLQEAEASDSNVSANSQ
jgi:serine/threonine protein kinase